MSNNGVRKLHLKLFLQSRPGKKGIFVLTDGGALYQLNAREILELPGRQVLDLDLCVAPNLVIRDGDEIVDKTELFLRYYMLESTNAFEQVTGSFYECVKEAIENFTKHKLGPSWTDALWTHGSLAPGCGAVFNSYPFTPKTGFGAQHLHGVKAVTFTDPNNINITISESYCFINGNPATKADVYPYVSNFLDNLERQSNLYSSK